MKRPPNSDRRPALFHLLGPGLLVAATGVGAGDLMTAGLAGSRVGLAVLWAAVVGAALKWVLNEGIARWQMATGTTLLEGWVQHLGRWIQWVFLGYLLIWSFFTGGALVTACGVAGTALLPLGDDLRASKIAWGVAHSLAGLVLVWAGGFKLFERLMSLCIALMFVTVVGSAALSAPSWTEVAGGLVRPTIPPGATAWVLGVLGGVGGTVTLLSYGYWVREKGRQGAPGLRACRLDLGVGYLMTALFGVAMVVLGSGVQLQKGPTVALDLANQLQSVIGVLGKWVFLAGFWGAVFSSLLGVWQSVPYMFADFMSLRRDPALASNAAAADVERSPEYRSYLLAMALIPLAVLWVPVVKAQLAYAIMGALFMPLLALTLLILNNSRRWIAAPYRNGALINAALVITLLFFAFLGFRELWARLSPDG